MADAYTLSYTSAKAQGQNIKPKYVVIDAKNIAEARKMAMTKIARNYVRSVERTSLKGKFPDGTFAVKVTKGSDGMWNDSEGYVLKRNDQFIWAIPKGTKMVYRPLKEDGNVESGRKMSTKGLRTSSGKSTVDKTTLSRVAQVAQAFGSVANVITIMSIL